MKKLVGVCTKGFWVYTWKVDVDVWFTVEPWGARVNVNIFRLATVALMLQVDSILLAVVLHRWCVASKLTLEVHFSLVDVWLVARCNTCPQRSRNVFAQNDEDYEMWLKCPEKASTVNVPVTSTLRVCVGDYNIHSMVMYSTFSHNTLWFTTNGWNPTQDYSSVPAPEEPKAVSLSSVALMEGLGWVVKGSQFKQ